MEISKKDWKLFREKLSDWQENYMEGLVKEYANFLNDDKKPASEKFWKLEKRIKEDKHHPGVIMELKKSEVIWDIEYYGAAEPPVRCGESHLSGLTEPPIDSYSA